MSVRHEVKPTCSVVIPTYNGAAFIGHALESAFAQTLLPAEVLVVDDASSDDTPALVQTALSLAPVPVRLIRLPRNSGGPAKPTNIGIRAARGELISVLDQDDVFVPRKLEEQAAGFALGADVVLVGGRAASVDAPETIKWEGLGWPGLNWNSPGAKPRRFSGLDVLSLLLAHGMFLSGYPGFMFRKSAWAAAGGIDERLAIATDFDFACRLCLRGQVVLTPAVGYWRREHDANVTLDHRRMYAEVTRVRGRYWPKVAGRIGGRERARLYDDCLGHAYGARCAGLWGDAFRCVWSAVRIGGLRQTAIRQALGIAYNALVRKIAK
jgi:glycosyltransferase involved in cell wall biosynthesis